MCTYVMQIYINIASYGNEFTYGQFYEFKSNMSLA